MAITASRRNINTEPGTAEYTSNILKLFAESLESQPQAQVLDVGPACQENIMFFTRRVKTLYICDMFFPLVQCLNKKHPVSRMWKYLDYPPESFHGILLWELADRLDDQEVSTLAQLCHKMLKPGGMAVVLVLGEQAASSMVNSFVIGQDFRVYQRPQTHLHLPLRSRQNRDVLAMMAPLTPAKSFICRPGFMEFLFRRD
ncbi:MAG: hypothetical protein JSV60_10535 [Desulfobacterales bacterium]|nr:MAG: hypothetical protein JSV60_10535 [Desulfobacterales bacterium]